MSQHFIPPINFGLVENNLYRSGQPNELNFPFLEQLKLKTVIFLAPDDPNPRFLDFIEDHQIELCHLGYNQTNNQWDPISEEIVLEALERALDTKNYPLLVFFLIDYV